MNKPSPVEGFLLVRHKIYYGPSRNQFTLADLSNILAQQSIRVILWRDFLKCSNLFVFRAFLFPMVVHNRPKVKYDYGKQKSCNHVDKIMISKV